MWRTFFKKTVEGELRPASNIQNAAKITVVIPTFNSGNYIDIIARYYKNAGVRVKIIVDAKTSDATRDIAGRVADDVIEMKNDSTRVGGLIEPMSATVDDPWIFRMDDDELPTLSMLEFIGDAVRQEGIDAFKFPRIQCAVSRDGDLLSSRSTSVELHSQWRLYRRDRVTYTTRGHTPGFETGDLRWAFAPDEAKMIHLDWSVHSYEERLAKIARYDAHTPDHGSSWRHFYLFEDKDGYRDDFKRAYLPEFKSVAREIAERGNRMTLIDPAVGPPFDLPSR